MPANFCLVCKKICSKIRIYFLRTQALRITFEIMCTSEKSGVHFLWGDSGKYRAGTERTGVVGVVRLIQLSTVGEVFLEGTCPLSRCPQTAKFPAPCFWRTEKVGEKSDSFSRAERTRPLRPVCRLLLCDFGNVPVERFQRDFPLLETERTRHNLSLREMIEKALCRSKKMKNISLP